jgi:HlyD family secretion protein
MNKALKYLLIAAGLLVVLAIFGKKMGFIGKEKSTKVAVEQAELRTITEKVPASGKIQPEMEVKISPEVSGEIVELRVKEGEAVKKGQLLLKINPSVYVSAIDRVKASLNTSEANLSVAKAQFIDADLKFNRNAELHKSGAISDAEYETSQSQIAVSKLNVASGEFQVNSAKASLKEAQENLRRTIIVAPMDGIVSRLNVELGERVVGTAQMAGTELLRIADLENMEVVVEVNENEINKVNFEDEVEIEVDAYLGEMFKGKVTEIASSANLLSTSADQVTNFEVKIRILKSSYGKFAGNLGEKRSPFRPGMTATVDIITDVQNDILSVSIKAVSTRKDTSSSRVSKYARGTNKEENTSNQDSEQEPFECVFVIAEGKAVLKMVETGIQDNNFIEVKGLKEGEEVITGPYSAVSKTLRNRTKIEVVSENQLFQTND